MMSPGKRLRRDSGGQAMMETALVLPFLLGLAFNAVNFGYLFIIAINLAAAPRSGVEYSILGSATPSSPNLPSPGPVKDLTVTDLTGAINISGISVPQVQVGSPTVGITGSGQSQKSIC